ncbi:GNAT superfamily N-acetyltransferase [Oxalobacteraceae bacterium GrIS 1.18]
MTSTHSHRLATLDDLPALRILMDLSIRTYIGAILSPEQLEASFEIMGVDTSLISDGTYFVVEHAGQIVACGGWSRRATLYGGDHTTGRDARLLDPATECARVRAMYVHPDHGRKGIGSLLLALCEKAASSEGFAKLELMSTVSGEQLYLAHGYLIAERVEVPTSTGVAVPLIRMTKRIA